MKILELLEKSHYDKKHECETPGAVYSSDISPEKVSMHVKLPMKLSLTKDESEKLEAELHYAIEKVLAQYFK
jgi:hypothetical protein